MRLVIRLAAALAVLVLVVLVGLAMALPRLVASDTARARIQQIAQDADLIVAGRNWGCGSSREQAPENVKLLGVGAVIAESFGRIYFRNCVAIAFPNLVCLGIAEACEEGDELEVDIGSGRVRNLTQGTELEGEAYTPDMLEIVEKGGLLKMLEERMKAAGKSSG